MRKYLDMFKGSCNTQWSKKTIDVVQYLSFDKREDFEM